MTRASVKDNEILHLALFCKIHVVYKRFDSGHRNSRTPCCNQEDQQWARLAGGDAKDKSGMTAEHLTQLGIDLKSTWAGCGWNKYCCVVSWANGAGKSMLSSDLDRWLAAPPKVCEWPTRVTLGLFGCAETEPTSPTCGLGSAPSLLLLRPALTSPQPFVSSLSQQ